MLLVVGGGTCFIFAGFLAPMATGGPSLRSALESPGSSELNEEESPDPPDADYMEEYDSEEDRKLKRKKRPPPKIRSTVGNNINSSSTTRSTKAADNDKPFPCSCKYRLTCCSLHLPFNIQHAIGATRQRHL